MNFASSETINLQSTLGMMRTVAAEKYDVIGCKLLITHSSASKLSKEDLTVVALELSEDSQTQVETQITRFSLKPVDGGYECHFDLSLPVSELSKKENVEEGIEQMISDQSQLSEGERMAAALIRNNMDLAVESTSELITVNREGVFFVSFIMQSDEGAFASDVFSLEVGTEEKPNIDSILREKR